MYFTEYRCYGEKFQSSQGTFLRFAGRVDDTARRAGRPESARQLLRSALDPLGPQAKPAVKSEATSPSRAGSLTPHRVNWWCGARLAPCIRHGGSPILQAPMHAAFMAKKDHKMRCSDVGTPQPIVTTPPGSSWGFSVHGGGMFSARSPRTPSDPTCGPI